MYAITCAQIERTYANHGLHCEQMLAYTLTGEMRRHDNCPFDIDSDIPEYHMSVKSSGATLVSGSLMQSTTFEGQLDEFFKRTASTCFAYVSDADVAYVMTPDEFRDFVLRFAIFTPDSAKNGGKKKIRLYKESGKMRKYLTQCISASP